MWVIHVVINLLTGIIYIHQSIALYTLNLHNVVCQSYLSKAKKLIIIVL